MKSDLFPALEDITFAEKSGEEIESAIISTYESLTDRTLAKGDVDLYILMKDGTLPSDEVLGKVLEICNLQGLLRSRPRVEASYATDECGSRWTSFGRSMVRQCSRLVE